MGIIRPNTFCQENSPIEERDPKNIMGSDHGNTIWPAAFVEEEIKSI